MFPIQERTKLMERTAEALTDPDFDALTSLEDNGRFITLEAKIRQANTPITVAIQRKSQHTWEYRLVQNDTDYDGRLQLTSWDDRVLAAQFLDRVGKRKVNNIQVKPLRQQGNVGGGSTPIGYQNGKKFIRFDPQEIKNVRYWVPTVVNRFAQNANNFLIASGPREIQTRIDFEDPGNSYRLAILRDSPTPHFRDPHTRVLDLPDGRMEVSVSGTYVNTNWQGYSTSEIQESLRQHAEEISTLHFARVLLPAIVNAGHDQVKIAEAYFNNLSKN